MHQVLPHRAESDKVLFSPCTLFKWSFDKPDLAEYLLTSVLEINLAILCKAKSVQGWLIFSAATKTSK